jgi:hypothetical protein
MTDKRRSQRRRVLWSGRIVHSGGAFNVGCAIRDMSPEGAKVRLSQAGADLPETVHFIDVRGRIAYEAKVMWRKGPTDLGLEFIAQYRLDLHLPAELEHLSRIWNDACAQVLEASAIKVPAN